jgi:16S rRNA (guanine966-N2)-methyltransferase
VRVIAGVAKGTRLAPAPAGVRPLTDRARAGLFSSIFQELPRASVLDLYAGTGALAIEALSRGAERATLVERDAAAIRTIRANLSATKLATSARVVRADVARFVTRNDNSRPFDLLFVDPPWDLGPDVLGGVLSDLDRGPMLGTGSTLALCRRARNPIDVIPVDWRPARRLVYGDGLVTLYRR